MLDYIKANEQNLKLFKQFKKKDVKLVSDYNSEKKKQKNDLEKLKNKEKEIETNISSFFKTLQPKEKI